MRWRGRWLMHYDREPRGRHLMGGGNTGSWPVDQGQVTTATPSLLHKAGAEGALGSG